MPFPSDAVKSLAESYRGRSVLVTGGLGFIGSNLAHRLVSLGADVLVVDALLPRHGGNLANIVGLEGRLGVNRVDLRDRATMRELLRGREIVFNLAGQVSHLDSMQDPVTDLEVNSLAQVMLLEEVRAVAPESVVVYASTRQIYGRPHYLPVDERHPLRPVDVNGVNKMSGEAFHSLYHQVYGLRTVSLRLTNTYGPRLRIKDARQTFLGIWLRRAIEDGIIEVWGGEQRRDLAYVDDAVDAFLLAATTEAVLGQVYNVGGSPSISLGELAALLVRIAGSGQVEQREFPPERKRIDIGDYVADDRRFRADTGWVPAVGVEEGLTRSLAYFREHFAAYTGEDP